MEGREGERTGGGEGEGRDGTPQLQNCGCALVGTDAVSRINGRFFCAATVVNVLLSSDVGRIGKYAFKNSVHYIIA